MSETAKKGGIAAAILAAGLAGAGVGRATVPSPPAPKLERICIEADGSAQVYTDLDGKRRQLLIPPNHALAVMRREGGKVADIVPKALSRAVMDTIAEAQKLAAEAK